MSRSQTKFLLLVRHTSGSLAVPRFEPHDFATGWLDRCADLLRTTRFDLAQWLGDGDRDLLQLDIDAEPWLLIKALRRWTDQPGEWGGLTPLKGPAHLAATKRISFCPLCLAVDVRRGRLPYFRAQWTWAWVTHCQSHRTPLFRWDVLRETRLGERALPPDWVAKSLGKRCRTLRSVELEHATRIQAMLRAARAARGWMEDNSPYAWFWRQQVAFEQQLHLLRAGRVTGDILGGFEDRRTLLRTIDDLAVLLGSNFTRAEREPWASGWRTYLGPDGLFGGFLKLPAYDGVAMIDPVREMADPRARRTVLAMIGRMLLAFRTDVFCSSPKAPSEPGFNALTSDLRNLPDAAKQWCERRWDGWAEVVRRGVQRSL